MMSFDTYKEMFDGTPLQGSDIKLRTYTGATLNICGKMICNVEYKGQKKALPIIIVGYKGKPSRLE